MKSMQRNFVFAILLTILFYFGAVRAHASIQVVLPDTTGPHGYTVSIPLTVSNIVTEDSIYSFQMILTFDSLVLTADSAYSSTISQPWGSPIFNNSIPGEIRIDMAGAYPLSGSGVLIYVVFVVNGSEDDTTTIHFHDMLFNEDPKLDLTDDGLFTVGSSSDVKDENEFLDLPTKITLYQNVPNPFNPMTQIRYSLPSNGHVRLDIYNLLGQKVATLVDEYQATGQKTVNWEAKDLSSGIYFYRLEVDRFSYTKRMVIIK